MASRPSSPRSSPSRRLFWGIALAGELQHQLQAWLAQATDRLPLARWVAPENIHLTLAFLGERPAQEGDGILASGRRLAREHVAFDLHSADLGAFPAWGRGRVLWAGVAPEPRLDRLAASLQEAMRGFGCRPDEGPWRPHLTLARLRSPVRMPDLPALAPLRIPVHEVHLFRSDPGAGGSTYRSLGAAALSPSRPPGP